MSWIFNFVINYFYHLVLLLYFGSCLIELEVDFHNSELAMEYHNTIYQQLQTDPLPDDHQTMTSNEEFQLNQVPLALY